MSPFIAFKAHHLPLMPGRDPPSPTAPPKGIFFFIHNSLTLYKACSRGRLAAVTHLPTEGVL